MILFVMPAARAEVVVVKKCAEKTEAAQPGGACPQSDMAMCEAQEKSCENCTGECVSCPNADTKETEGVESEGDEEGDWSGWWNHIDSAYMDMEAMNFMCGVKTVAILPFLDITQDSADLVKAGGPAALNGALATELMNRGYLVIPSIDVAAVINGEFGESGPGSVKQEAVNNRFYANVMPSRAMDFYYEMVPGLREQLNGQSGSTAFVPNPINIQKLAKDLGADCLIRGFISEFTVGRHVSQDLRTFLPPFLGLINPDRRAKVMVMYYLYDGKTGQIIWNGAVSVCDKQGWPLFTEEIDLINRSRNDAVYGLTGRIVPSWESLVMGHPGWGGPWGAGYSGWENGAVNPPDWVNPMRQGWHWEYERSRIRGSGPYMGHPYKFEYIIPSYHRFERPTDKNSSK